MNSAESTKCQEQSSLPEILDPSFERDNTAAWSALGIATATASGLLLGGLGAYLYLQSDPDSCTSVASCFEQASTLCASRELLEPTDQVWCDKLDQLNTLAEKDGASSGLLSAVSAGLGSVGAAWRLMRSRDDGDQGMIPETSEI